MSDEPTDDAVAEVATWLRHDADRIHDWTPEGVAIRLRHYADRLDSSVADPEAGKCQLTTHVRCSHPQPEAGA